MVCLDLWSGRNSGPHLHSMHFAFSIGAFVTPFLAKPFLSYRHHRDVDGNAFNNSTEANSNSTIDDASEESRISILYLVLGIGTVITSSAFLIVGLRKALGHRLKRRRGAYDAAEAEGMKHPKK